MIQSVPKGSYVNILKGSSCCSGSSRSKVTLRIPYAILAGSCQIAASIPHDPSLLFLHNHLPARLTRGPAAFLLRFWSCCFNLKYQTILFNTFTLTCGREHKTDIPKSRCKITSKQRWRYKTKLDSTWKRRQLINVNSTLLNHVDTSSILR